MGKFKHFNEPTNLLVSIHIADDPLSIQNNLNIYNRLKIESRMPQLNYKYD